MTLSDEKSHLRRELKLIRAALDDCTRQKAASLLCDRLWNFLQEQSVKNLGVYLARPVEISIDPLIEKLLDAQIEISAPCLDLEKVAMTFRRLHSLDALRLGAFNVREPLDDEVAFPTLVLVPGLAFDARGHRLGMGGGWYDRTITPEMTTIGLCFDCQVIPDIPAEEHDKGMNWVFSEKRQFGPF